MKQNAVCVSVALAAALLMMLASVSSLSLPREDRKRQERIEWVAGCLKQMQAVRAGMTRKEIEKILTMEGGLYSPTTGHYVSRECPYFKVDVEFTAARDKDGRAVFGGHDRIVKVSRPYLDWPTID